MRAPSCCQPFFVSCIGLGWDFFLWGQWQLPGRLGPNALLGAAPYCLEVWQFREKDLGPVQDDLGRCVWFSRLALAPGTNCGGFLRHSR